MSDSTPMTPEEAQEVLEDIAAGRPLVVRTYILRQALATIAGMRVEEDCRIVPTDSNGGKYETLRHTRLVSEWVAGQKHAAGGSSQVSPHGMCGANERQAND